MFRDILLGRIAYRRKYRVSSMESRGRLVVVHHEAVMRVKFITHCGRSTRVVLYSVFLSAVELVHLVYIFVVLCSAVNLGDAQILV